MVVVVAAGARRRWVGSGVVGSLRIVADDVGIFVEKMFGRGFCRFRCGIWGAFLE